MDKYILALDQGTTSCRAFIYDKKGLTGTNIAAIGITNQRETVVVCDKKNQSTCIQCNCMAR